MFDLRPVGYIIGLLLTVLGAAMLLPLGMDLLAGNGEWPVFLESAIITALTGTFLAISCANGVGRGLTIRQTFLVTTLVWLILAIFAAVPFILGDTQASITDAFFESMSGLTTTGSTVFTGLDDLPAGILLWRSLLQWMGGIGIVVVAMVFLPELRVGGMQIFRSEAFDTLGKILPRAAEIAARITWIYLGLTFAAFLAFAAVGMTAFDALCHALTAISTGGFSTTDASFGAYQGAPEYVATVVMLLASLPFVRYIQLLAGTARPFFEDTQIRAYFTVIGVTVAGLFLFQVFVDGLHPEQSFREAIFNVVSIISGTGFASVDYQLWGAVPVVIFFFLGLVGGCAGSTSCSVKIFRYQILLSAVRAQIRAIHSPHGMFLTRFDGRPVGPDVLNSVMAFFSIFVVSLGALSILLSMTGLDFTTSVSGAATAIANIGPGLGDTIGPAGNFSTLNPTAKWLLAIAMLVGRLELLVVYAILTVNFWRS
ncbi:TrkH family potassium uptake protein [Roseicyclus sp. F158]|uniref:Trk system potassium uptake protein n=1 Tax=Tropicimonas omnivorans TaxID=3075590 RepID=A0ABU3DFW6_9RHOB|nr:TrkH family potassium uptake protein [Roseicyclus sp. F158]MDT0682612.1 TrkH family potassium uptake protein [Roseicyclus sp. F158]